MLAVGIIVISQQSTHYGFNAMVAIATYSGYNQEDGVIVNLSSVQRGLYQNTYSKTYSDFEEENQKTGESTQITNPFQMAGIKIKKGANYQHLDENGLIRKGTKIKENMVIIGKVLYYPEEAPVMFL